MPRATRWAKHNVDVLKPYVEAGCDILSPGPTCSYMIKHEWADYLGTDERMRASIAATLKLRGRVELVAPGGLPRDGKVIDDQRSYD